MNQSSRWAFVLIGGALAFLSALQVLPVQAEGPVVHAVLFYSPTCGHCHQVMTKDLPPLAQRYGTQLEIVGVNVSLPDGSALFEAAMERFRIQSFAVPMLIVGEVVLVGSEEIPEQLPGLIEKHLAQGGVAWPDLPGLAEAMAAAPSTPTKTAMLPTLAMPTTPFVAPASRTPTLPSAVAAEPSTRVPTPVALTTTGSSTPAPPPPTRVAVAPIGGMNKDQAQGLGEKLARDPAGNALAVIVLIGMVIAVGRSIRIWSGFGGRLARTSTGEWMVPVLALVGLGVAGYLAFVETTHSTPTCGPVGDCNTVQQSEYAWLFGIIPIGVLGVLGYVAILIVWAVVRFAQVEWSDRARIALCGLTFLGTLFSIYLTFLEPFVIGATCAWCLTSAVVMTALLGLTVTPGQQAVRRLRSGG